MMRRKGLSFLIHARRYSSESVPQHIDQPGVYAWGRGVSGQFGQGKYKTEYKQATKLEFPTIPHPLTSLKKIYTLEENTVLQFDIEGTDVLYGMGLGSYGNAGFFSNDPIYHPVEFPVTCEEHFSARVKDIFHGRFHTLFLTGRLSTSSDNPH
jgi:alpha-tubulin suppressor-like RCC1 family protein